MRNYRIILLSTRQKQDLLELFYEGAHKKDKEYFNLHYVMMATRGLIVHRNQINYKTTN